MKQDPAHKSPAVILSQPFISPWHQGDIRNLLSFPRVAPKQPFYPPTSSLLRPNPEKDSTTVSTIIRKSGGLLRWGSVLMYVTHILGADITGAWNQSVFVWFNSWKVYFLRFRISKLGAIQTPQEPTLPGKKEQ